MTGPEGRPGEGFTLGVDLGTSHTVAMLRWPDGRTRPLLFDGQPLLPSAVYLDMTGRLHVGRDAQRLGSADPVRVEPNPKRHIDAESVLLAGTAVPVSDLFAALLGGVAHEAVATAGFLPPAVLTYPAAWGARRRAILTEALAKAGWPARTALVPEPVAAARYFTDVLRRPVPVGSALAVFDFGGGTLDVAVVRNEGHGPDGQPRFEVASSGGADDLGGLDVDAALVDHLGKSLAGAESRAWDALSDPETLAQWRARRQFWEDVRGAKEMLSRAGLAPVPVPGVEQAVHVSRDELEGAAGPLIRRGVAEAGAVIKAAGLTPGDLAGLFLVGGSSRVPLVARLLHSELGIAPIVLEQPELPVAEGAIVVAAAAPAPAAPAPSPAASAAPAELAATAPTVPSQAPPGSTPASSAPPGSMPASLAPPGSTPAAPAPPGPTPASSAPAGSTPARSGPAGRGDVRYQPGHAAAATPPPTAETVPDHPVPPSPAPPRPTSADPAPDGWASDGRAPDGRASDGRAPDGRASDGQAAGGRAPDGWAAGGQAVGGQAAGGQAAGGRSPSSPAPTGPMPTGPMTDETGPRYAEPVDPWATGEAAALAASGGAPLYPGSGAPAPGAPAPGAPAPGAPAPGAPAPGAPAPGAPAPGATAHGAPGSGATAQAGHTMAPPPGEPWLASTQPDAAPPAVPAYRRKWFLLVAAAVVVVLGAGATLAVIFWPGYPALDYQPLAGSKPMSLAPAVPVTSGFSNAQVSGDRAYFASAGEPDAASQRMLGVTAAEADTGDEIWKSTKAGSAADWDQMVALPNGVAIFTDTDTTTDRRRMVILGADRGDLLWQRSIGGDDGVLFSGSLAVLVDRVEHRLIGLRLADGKTAWETPDVKTDAGTATAVLSVSTPDDLAGPATVLGAPLTPDLSDDQRLVQIGADRSARVIDAATGDVKGQPLAGVANPDSPMTAHNGRLFVSESANNTQRILAYDLESGKSAVLVTLPGTVQVSHLTSCGAERVCWVETTAYDAKTNQVTGVNAVDGSGAWRKSVPGADDLVPIGDHVLASQDGSPTRSATLLDSKGNVAWTINGVAARLDGGNLLQFSKALTSSPDDPSLAGRHLGDGEQPLGPLSGVRSQTCSWNTSVIACVTEKDFRLQRFAG